MYFFEKYLAIRNIADREYNREFEVPLRPEKSKK